MGGLALHYSGFKEGQVESNYKNKQIFENAFITIIAVSAPNATAGFLKMQPLHNSCMTTLRYCCDDGRIGQIDLKERRNWNPDMSPFTLEPGL